MTQFSNEFQKFLFNTMDLIKLLIENFPEIKEGLIEIAYIILENKMLFTSFLGSALGVYLIWYKLDEDQKMKIINCVRNSFSKIKEFVDNSKIIKFLNSNFLHNSLGIIENSKKIYYFFFC